MRILIPTVPDDEHAINVSFALEKNGHESVLWYTADFPVNQKNSFELGNGISRFTIGNIDLNDSEKYDTVWYRRPAIPVISKQLHPDDRENSCKENRSFFESMWRVVSPDSRWINPLHSARSANCKMLQLRMALNANFQVAPTLISNHPQKIRQFIRTASRGDVIFKSLYPLAWREEDGIRLHYTRVINVEDLPSDAILQSTPGIYQYRINKAYELRVTYMGGHILAVKLDSQSHPKGKQDWRAAPIREMGIEIYELPEKLIGQCRSFMNSMGLVFGCLDFIVTPDGQYYFLEVNEQGQFLWIEEVNPDIPMLDIFSEFLVCPVKNFSYSFSRNKLSLLDFIKMTGMKRQVAVRNHVSPEYHFS